MQKNPAGLIAAFFLSAAPLSGADLKVTLESLAQTDAKVFLCVYTHEEGFPDDPTRAAVCRIIDPAQGTTVVLPDVPLGVVAVSAFQDLNGNGKLDRGLFGIPKEPVGTSGKPFRARPKFAAAAVRFEAPAVSIPVGFRTKR